MLPLNEKDQLRPAASNVKGCLCRRISVPDVTYRTRPCPPAKPRSAAEGSSIILFIPPPACAATKTPFVTTRSHNYCLPAPPVFFFWRSCFLPRGRGKVRYLPSGT